MFGSLDVPIWIRAVSSEFFLLLTNQRDCESASAGKKNPKIKICPRYLTEVGKRGWMEYSVSLRSSYPMTYL